MSPSQNSDDKVFDVIPTLVILVRHGETLWTREKRFQGATDISLSAEGRRSTKRLLSILKRYRPTVLTTSTLCRARQTGQILGRGLRLRSQLDRRLNEIQFGRWEGRTAQEIWQSGDRQFRRWCRGEWVTPTGGESVSHLRQRVCASLSEILCKYRGQRIVVVSHGGVIKMMIAMALKLPPRACWRLRVDPASISVLAFYPRFVELLGLNIR